MTKIKTKPAKKAAKKSTKKVAKKPKRRVCKTKRCMKTALDDGIFCPGCAKNNDPAEVVVKTTELEALRWAKLDTEFRNDRQAIQIFDFKCKEIKDKAEQEIAGLVNQRAQLEAAITARKPEYQELVKSLAKRYGIKDPARMTIDPDTQVIRDLSKM